jgi:hypothetical protein
LCGRFNGECFAQLAVMDAIIFFIGAVLVSNILISYVPSIHSSSQGDLIGGDTDPAEVLRTFLATCLCESVVVDLGQPFYMDDRTTAAESLAIELAALETGHDGCRFDLLNALLHEMLRAACNPALEPYLLVIDPDHDSSGPVLLIPHVPDTTDNAYASSTEIPGPGTTTYVVELVLCPPLLPELIEI